MKQQITPELLAQLMRGQENNPQDQMQEDIGQEEQISPFDRGVMKAMQSARDMIDLTGKQKGEAMALAIAKFNQGLDQSEPARGFWSNVGRVSDAFAPAYETYNTQEQSAQGKNQQLAQLVQQMQAQQLQRKALAKKEKWKQNYKLAKLEETKQKHGSDLEYKRAKLFNKDAEARRPSKDEIKALEKEEHLEQFANLLDHAEQKILEHQEKGERGVVSRYADKYSPIGKQKSVEQEEIDSMGKLIKDELSLIYKPTDVRFKGIPLISPDNPWKNNLAILNEIKQTMGISPKKIPMIDPQGNRWYMHPEDYEDALTQGYRNE